MKFDYIKSTKVDDALYEYLELARLLRLKKNQTILDVGCGLNHLKHVYDNVVGIDLARNSNADVICDCLHLPFRDNIFDVAVSVELIEHLPPNHVDRFISELIRVSKKFIGISTVNKLTGKHDFRHVREFTVFELLGLFKRNGLRINDIGYGGRGKRFKGKFLGLLAKWLLPFWLTCEWFCIVGEKAR